MSATDQPAAGRRPPSRHDPRRRRWIWSGIIVLLVIAMLLDTKIVPEDSPLGQDAPAFDAALFGLEGFPKAQEFITANAVMAADLADAVEADGAVAAAERFGHSGDGAIYVVPIRFAGTVGEREMIGGTPVSVAGLPDDITVTVQLGPAIFGADLRDVTGEVTINSFDDQIEYQNAGAAINDELKKYLAEIDIDALPGETVEFEGALRLENAAQWDVTPSRITVEK